MGRSICIGVAMLASLLVGERSALAILIFDSEADYLSSATIVSTSTFDSSTSVVFHDQVIAIDGVVYSTSLCSIHCWAYADQLGTPRIGDDILSFGPDRYVEDAPWSCDDRFVVHMAPQVVHKLRGGGVPSALGRYSSRRPRWAMLVGL